MKKILFTIITFFVIISCNDETEVDLGNNFNYAPFREAVFDMTAFAGNGIFRYDNNFEVPVVFPTIEDYKFDSTYIIVKQKFDNNNTLKLLKYIHKSRNGYFKLDSTYGHWNKDYYVKTFNEFGEYYDLAKDVMDNTPIIQEMKKNETNYYIIDKSTGLLTGPMTEKEFLTTIKEKNIALKF